MKYQLSELENVHLPYSLKAVSMQTVIDPHEAMLRLQQVKKGIITLPFLLNYIEEIDSLTINCKEVLNDAHILCRKFNQSIQKILYEKKYDKLIGAIHDFIKNYPICNVAQKAINMINKIIPYCYDQLLHYMMSLCERFILLTSDYHEIILIVIPYVQLAIKFCKQITSSLASGSPNIESTFRYAVSGKYNEDLNLVRTNRFKILENVTPIYLAEEAS